MRKWGIEECRDSAIIGSRNKEIEGGREGGREKLW